MIRSMKKYSFISLLFLFFQPGLAMAQITPKPPKPDGTLKSIRFDTVQITITEAEQTFLKNNLNLLAQKYGVDATQALIIQARLYYNPSFSYGNNIYNTDTHTLFPLSFTWPKSDNSFSLSQEIVLAHKIKKQVGIAETNYVLAKDNFADLLRTLKYTLRSSYYNIYYLRQITKVYDEEINALDTVVAAYKLVEGRNLVSEAEIVQVQAQLYSLQSEYQGWVDNINDLESQLRLLLQAPPTTYILPVVNPDMVKTDPRTYGLGTLLDSAYVNRTDFMIARDNTLLSRQNYSLQKALAIPDITVGLAEDESSQYVANDFSYSFGFDIPLFNRNQGNIKNANLTIKSNEAQELYTQKSVDEQVFRGLQKAIDADKLYKGIDTTFAPKFDTLAAEMLKQYLNRNVNLLTFQAFYDSYKTNIEQLNTILYNKVNTLESLNLLTGTNFFNK
jgi:outer membrane protein, heavy metal efflux system